MFIQDNSGALLQDEEYVITEDLRSGRQALVDCCNCKFISIVCRRCYAVKHKEGGFQSNLAKIILTARKPPKAGKEL